MPTYEYRCPQCGDFEFTQKITDEVLKICPTCGGEVTRLLSAPAFHLKGSGWYKTDYGSSSGDNGAADSQSTETKSADASDVKKIEPKATDSSEVKPAKPATPAKSEE